MFKIKVIIFAGVLRAKYENLMLILSIISVLLHLFAPAIAHSNHTLQVIGGFEPPFGKVRIRSLDVNSGTLT